MGCVAIIGREEDSCCRLVRTKLEQQGREVLWLPEDQLFPCLDFAWNVWEGGCSGLVRHLTQQAGFAEIGGVLARFYGIPVTPDAFTTSDGRYISSEWHALILAWMAALPCPVINRLKP